MRRATKLIGVGCALTAVAAVTVAATRDEPATEGTGAATTASATTEIVRRDLVEYEQVDGRLGYADARPAFAQRSGTITWLPRRGARVQTGQRLFQVDGRSVFLFDGAQPAYRALGPGMRGTDVAQVERTLRSLGHDPESRLRIDGTWDDATTAALQRWQDRVGLPTTGRLALGDIVFAPGDRRVAAIDARLGGVVGSAGAAAAGGAATTVLTTTSVRQIVSIDLSASQQEFAVPQASVKVTLPGDRVARGTVVRRSSVANASPSPQQGASAPPATVKVIVKLSESAGAVPDQSPVEVDLTSKRADDVLAVPVTALVAQEGGRFAVEVREGARRRVVPVRIGISSDSMIEISGAGLRPGLLVSNAAV